MPIRRFRSIEEMDGNQWYARNDPQLVRAIERVWRFGRETLRPYFPPGIYRHRSIDDAEGLAEKWRQESFRRFRERARS
jgi:hypothetical protein